MSMKAVIHTEIRNMSILKDTLTEMGYKFSAVGADALSIQAAYPMSINCAKGEINYDSSDKTAVEKIMVSYQRKFIRDQAIAEGSQVYEEVLDNGDIHISIRNS
jgi:hypothetical protein